MSETVYLAVQYLVISLYILIIFNSSVIMYTAHKVDSSRWDLRLSCFLMAILMFSQASLYIHLQLEWIADSTGEAVGEETDTEWLVYDYLTGFTIYLMSHVTKIVINLRHKEREGENE